MVQDQWPQQKKMKLLLSDNLETVIQRKQWTFGVESLMRKNREVGKTLSSRFILKIILPRVVGFKCIAW